eukprot:gene19064-24366_t
MQRASVASVIGAISVCIVLTEGGVAHAELTGENDEVLLLSSDFVSMAVTAISDTLLKCEQIVVYATRNSANQVASSSSSSSSNKAKSESLMEKLRAMLPENLVVDGGCLAVAIRTGD